MGYHMRMNDIFMLKGLGTQMQEYTQAQQKLSLVDHLLNSHEHIRFSRHMNRIHMDEGFGELAAGEFIVLEVFSIIAPDTFTDVYNDHYLKKYLTALIKRQWGANLMKFQDFQLPGGITLNGRQIYEDAVEEIQGLEEESRLIWAMPDNFLMG